jgi:hypothetical protein
MTTSRLCDGLKQNHESVLQREGTIGLDHLFNKRKKWIRELKGSLEIYLGRC